MIIGIDPGKTGAVAAYHEGKISVLRFSKSSHVFKDFLTKRLPLVKGIWVEQVNAAPIAGRRQGTTSMFNFGHQVGWIIGTLEALDLNYELVRPYRWQTVIKIPPKRSNDETYPERKRRIREYAKQLFPQEKVTAETADALLIMEYGRMVYNKRNHHNKD